MQPNSLGLMIVYENLWSAPFAVAARQAGGQLWPRATSPSRPSWPHSTPSSPDERSLSCLDYFEEWPAPQSWRVPRPPSATACRAVKPTVGPKTTNRPTPNPNTPNPSTRNRSTRNRSTSHQRPLHPPPRHRPTDMFEQLKQLAELRDQGILTDEEFAVQKARILAT